MTSLSTTYPYFLSEVPQFVLSIGRIERDVYFRLASSRAVRKSPSYLNITLELLHWGGITDSKD